MVQVSPVILRFVKKPAKLSGDDFRQDRYYYPLSRMKSNEGNGMALQDIAAGLEITEKQQDKGVATVDKTERNLTDRLAPFADELPCNVEKAASIVQEHASGSALDKIGMNVGIPTITVAKTLHLLGIEGICPLTPQSREIVRDWLHAEVGRSTARELTGASETEFQLTVYIETHEPLEGAAEAIEPTLTAGSNASIEKKELLQETMSTVDDLHNGGW